MADFDPFNATPTQLAENLFRSSMTDAYSAIQLAGSEKQYNEAMARSLAGMCEALLQLSKGLRATYATTHKLHQRIAHLERSLGNGK